jgi:hypothetical protein
MISPEIDSKSWSSLVASYAQAVGLRWSRIWGPVYRDAVGIMVQSPPLRALAGEVAARFHQLSRDVLVTPDRPTGFHFVLERDAQSAAPRYERIPPGWPRGNVVPVVSNLRSQSGDGSLREENLMVRVEQEHLSVSLVSLDPRTLRTAGRYTFDLAPARSDLRASRTGPASGPTFAFALTLAPSREVNPARAG